MKTNHLYFCITILLCLNAPIMTSHATPSEQLKRNISAFMQTALNSSRAAVQRNPVASAFLFLGGSYIAAESISYHIRKKTFLAGKCKTLMHDVTYWVLKKLLCTYPCAPEPEILTEPWLYKPER